MQRPHARTQPPVDPHRTLEPVHFEYRSPHGSQVCIAGSFNGWQPDAAPLHAVGPGRWRIRLLLPHGRHEYRLVVDGQWIADPTARLGVANPHGGLNSVIIVPTIPVLRDEDATPLPTEVTGPGDG